MRPSLLLATSLLLPTAAEAQACPFPGVTVTASPQPAAPGQNVRVTLTNESTEVVEIFSCLFHTIRSGSSCSGNVTLFSPCLATIIYYIPPGSSFEQTWDQLDSSGQPVAEGVYSVEAMFSVNGVPYQCCAPVTVCTTPEIVSYCSAGSSASGCRATLSATGTASASESSGFVVTASDIEREKSGMFFYGQNGRQAAPWGNGTSLRCVASPVNRGGLIPGSGSAGPCSGLTAQDLNARWCPTCPKPNQGPFPGQKMQVQFWYRDPLSTSNRTSSLSNALEVDVCP